MLYQTAYLLDDVSYVLGKGAPERFCKLHGSAGKPLVTSEAGEMGQKKLVSYMLNALLVLLCTLNTQNCPHPLRQMLVVLI